MPRVVVFDSEYITVEYLSDNKIIRHTVHKPVEPKFWLEALNAGTDALIEHGACKWLSDDRKMGPLPTDDESVQGSNAWTERTIAAGWKYWANVVPVDVISAGSLIGAMDALHQLGLRMMVFDDVEKAIAWLDSLEQNC